MIRCISFPLGLNVVRTGVSNLIETGIDRVLTTDHLPRSAACGKIQIPIALTR
jgi:hypothetical protein